MNPNCPQCAQRSTAVYGRTRLANGCEFPWLRFVWGALTVDDANAEAIKQALSGWPGAVAWVTDAPATIALHGKDTQT